MNKITSPECLQNCIDKYSAEFEAKIKGTNGKRAVVVCGGTGCLANASADIIEELKRLVKEKGLEDKVSVNHVGCFGFCSQGPFVKIFPEDTLYRAVKVSDVKQIVEGGYEQLLDYLQVAEIARWKVVCDQKNVIRQRLELVALCSCQLEYVWILLVGHYA